MFESRFVPLDYPIDEVINYRALRKAYDAKVTSYLRPELLPDSRSRHDLLEGLEKDLFNGDYTHGTANLDDELLFNDGSSPVLLTAEHATDHKRNNPKGQFITKKRDFGTGSLALSAAADTKSSVVVSLGRQTGDANRDDSHPVKEKITEVISSGISMAHLSVHGMESALANKIDAERGFSIMVGFGPDPSEATRTWAYDTLLPHGAELGLKIGVNDAHLRFSEGRPVLSSDGTKIATKIYGGSGLISGVGETTRDHSQKIARQLGIDDEFISAQLEFSSVLRRHPDVAFPTPQDKWAGALAGYLLLRLAAQTAAGHKEA